MMMSNDTNNEVIITEQYPANEDPVVPAAGNQDDMRMESPPNLSDNDPYDDMLDYVGKVVTKYLFSQSNMFKVSGINPLLVTIKNIII